MEGLKLFQPLPLRRLWQAPGPFKPCVFGTCIAYHSNMNDLVPVPKACSPPPPPSPFLQKSSSFFPSPCFEHHSAQIFCQYPTFELRFSSREELKLRLSARFSYDIHPTPLHSSSPQSINLFFFPNVCADEPACRLPCPGILTCSHWFP